MSETSYIIKRIPKPLWQSVKIKAATKGETIRQVLLRALERYAQGK